MSFFPRSFFAEKPKKEQPKRNKQLPSRKPKGPHKHYCLSCNMPFKCCHPNCTLPDKVMECYGDRPTFKTGNGGFLA